MRHYTDDLKIKEALQLYFSQYHFKDGGYNDKVFKIKLTDSLYISLPNIKARLDAVNFTTYITSLQSTQQFTKERQK